MTDHIDTAKEREKLANLDSADLYDMGIILLDALNAERAENERLREALRGLLPICRCWNVAVDCPRRAQSQGDGK